ncbi:hypothetical protein ACEQ8H_001344, partial [Pleosporales sp. CAS-2024a]
NQENSDKDMLFDLALQVISAQNLMYTSKQMQGFMWHVNLNFQWKAFIFLVSELRNRFEGPQVERAWQEIEMTFDFHPSFDQELAKRAMPIAASNLTLKAWDTYALAKGGVDQEPYFIRLIRQRQPQKKQTYRSPPQLDPHVQGSIITQGMGGDQNSAAVENVPLQDPIQLSMWSLTEFDTNVNMVTDWPDPVPMDVPENIGWTAWDNLFTGFQADGMEEQPQHLSTFGIESQ